MGGRELGREAHPRVLTFGDWVVEIARRPKGAQDFVLLPHRWIAERPCAWLGRWGRLSTDYEVLPTTSEAFIHLGMIHLMLRGLAPL